MDINILKIKVVPGKEGSPRTVYTLGVFSYSCDDELFNKQSSYPKLIGT